jgi:hypothetical protein
MECDSASNAPKCLLNNGVCSSFKNICQTLTLRQQVEITLSHLMSVRFFQPVYSIYEYYEIKITSKSFAQKFKLK